MTLKIRNDLKIEIIGANLFLSCSKKICESHRHPDPIPTSKLLVQNLIFIAHNTLLMIIFCFESEIINECCHSKE